MARKSKSTPSVDTPEKNIEQGIYWLPTEAKWGGFINISLDDDEKLSFHGWRDVNEGSGTVMLDDLLAEGIKFGISYDRENQCYISTLTGALVKGSNERYALTTRAGNMQEVVLLTMWKFVILAAGDCGSWSPKTGRLMNWG